MRFVSFLSLQALAALAGSLLLAALASAGPAPAAAAPAAFLTPTPARGTGTARPVARATRIPVFRGYTGRPPAVTPTPIVFRPPPAANLDSLWIGELNHAANVRNGPGTGYAPNRVWQKGHRVIVYRTAIATNGERWYQVEQYPNPDFYIHASLVDYVMPLARPATMHPGRWVDVNLTQQLLIAYENGQPQLVTLVATGKSGYETDVGVWKVYWRQRVQDMDGGGSGPSDTYYNLKDVPWIQYFNQSGEGLHGTYWHDDFGRQHSHGCVNLTQQDANWLYLWGRVGMIVQVHYGAPARATAPPAVPAASRTPTPPTPTRSPGPLPPTAVPPASPPPVTPTPPTITLPLSPIPTPANSPTPMPTITLTLLPPASATASPTPAVPATSGPRAERVNNTPPAWLSVRHGPAESQ